MAVLEVVPTEEVAAVSVGVFEAAEPGREVGPIANEAGYANGAIKPYFAVKHDLVLAVFDHVYERTAQRAIAATAGLHGVDALRAYCREIMPVTTEALGEARVVIPFRHHALTDATLIARHEAALKVWRRDLAGHLTDARAKGHVTASIDDRRIVELVLTTLHGSQITATLTPTSRRALARQLDDLLDLIAATPQG